MADVPSNPHFSSQSGPSAAQMLRALPMTQSAAAMVGTARRYSTQCAPLDKVLEGGLKRGHILELSGPPGCAKEQLAINVVYTFVESNHEVLFIDFQNMTSPATLSRALQKLPNLKHDYAKLIQHLNLHTLPDLIVFLRNLPSYLGEHPKVALLVLGSLSFAFQSPANLPNNARNALLDRVKQALAKACASTNLTVVITSQLATKLVNPDGSAANFDTGSRAIMVPQLGTTHLPLGRTYRVIVVPQGRSTGIVRLLSSPTHMPGPQPVREESYQLCSSQIGGMME
ncbi:hypothetical protein OBBRIDRAFT_758211 [Obba rivulosa]|uniref:DNA repair protein RAD51 homolog 3 n=1 Tax=Obba rivulosa TaxID=1052685 RepID=A0A8E2DIW6_9APHY|nr:hypothetical protein OBBRIDRAFT_758211 [Obba rivulosa]